MGGTSTMAQPIRTFFSVVDGEQAEVYVHADRLEWEQRIVRASRPGLRAEASWLMAHPPHAEVITQRVPIAAVSSVTVWAACSTFTAISVNAVPAPVEFRVSHADAAAVADLLTGLVLGAAPANVTSIAALPSQVRGANVADQIRTLGALYAAGILSAEEFFTEREALLTAV
ncbi:MAG TPA: SHOCT domain-containing protein [Sporichthyaceae bacterium]